MSPHRTDPSATACHAPRDNLVADPAAGDSICVLGIGNVLWADEGFGVRCIESLQRSHEFADHVQLIDGGTQGLYLVQHVQAASHLLIFDAIDYGLPPGTLKFVEDDDVPRFMGAKKMSLHQTGFQEVLALALLTERYPRRVLLVGCQPEEIDDYGGSLRPVVRDAMAGALAHGVSVLQAWGAQPVPRQRPLDVHDIVTFAELGQSRYEDERPSATQACRTGDVRFFPAV